MKTLAVHLPREQLDQLIAEARPGDVIVLTDGERRLRFVADADGSGAPQLDLDQDSPELATELLKAARGPFSTYSRRDLEAVADQVLREKHQE